MICSASACSRGTSFVRICLGDVLHDAEHPDDRAVFTVGGVAARGHPFFARARPNAVLDVVVAPARDGRLDGDSRALAIVGMQTRTQVASRSSRAPAPSSKIAAARGEKVTMSVAASQLQSPSLAASSARRSRSASEYVDAIA